MKHPLRVKKNMNEIRSITEEEAMKMYLDLKMKEYKFCKLKQNSITEHLENKVFKHF